MHFYHPILVLFQILASKGMERLLPLYFNKLDARIDARILFCTRVDARIYPGSPSFPRRRESSPYYQLLS